MLVLFLMEKNMKVVKTFNGDILIKERKKKTITNGGIYNPNSNKDMPYRLGEVVISSDDSPFKVGDIVAFEVYAGATISHNGIEHVILSAKNVFATIEDIEGDFE